MEGCDTEQEDCIGKTPLVWAATNGCEGVAETLLGRNDVSADKLDKCCRTPLYAARNGHEGMVKIPLRRDDIGPDKPDIYNQTPLFYAARSGHEGMVKK